MKAIPTVQKYMTYVPKSIGFDQPLVKAHDYMRKLHIRYLPVLKGDEFVGVLTDQHVNLILTFEDVDPKTMTVEKAYIPDPYFASPTSPLDGVTSEMAENKYACAIVVDNGLLVGIFTEVNAYKALSELLSSPLND